VNEETSLQFRYLRQSRPGFTFHFSKMHEADPMTRIGMTQTKKITKKWVAKAAQNWMS